MHYIIQSPGGQSKVSGKKRLGAPSLSVSEIKQIFWLDLEHFAHFKNEETNLNCYAESCNRKQAPNGACFYIIFTISFFNLAMIRFSSREI